MRVPYLLLVGASLAACGGGLQPRQPLAEVPIGTTNATSTSRSAQDDEATSSSGMVAAKIEDTDRGKASDTTKKKPAKKRGRSRR